VPGLVVMSVVPAVTLAIAGAAHAVLASSVMGVVMVRAVAAVFGESCDGCGRGLDDAGCSGNQSGAGDGI